MTERDVTGKDAQKTAGELPLPDEAWRFVPIAEAVKGLLSPGQVIEVPRITAYDTVEMQAFLTLLRAAHPKEPMPTAALGFRINDRGISQHVRPEGFNANLVDGTAAVSPFDAEGAIEYDTEPKPAKGIRARIRNGETPGIRIIYEGDLVRGVNQVLVGRVLQDVFYFYDLSLASSPDADLLYRALGPAFQKDKASQAMKGIVTSSVRTAESVARRAHRYADQHRASASVPGTGKRR